MLTPREILQTDFRQSFRGYHEKDVDAFVHRVVKAYETLSRQNKELTEQIATMQEDLDEVERAAAQRKELLRAAEEQAETVTAVAEGEARNRIRQAELRAEGIIKNAREAEMQAEVRIARLQAEERRVRDSWRVLLEQALQLLDEDEPETLKLDTERYTRLDAVSPVIDSYADGAADDVLDDTSPHLEVAAADDTFESDETESV